MPRTTSSASYVQGVGARLRARRQELQLTQAEVARRLDVSPTYVQNVEAGRANLTLGQLARVAVALGAFPRVVLDPLPDVEAGMQSLDELSAPLR